jgi:hypothetical protein
MRCAHIFYAGEAGEVLCRHKTGIVAAGDT